MLGILGKILLQMAMALITDPLFIRKALLVVARRAAELTPTHVDDDLLNLIEQSIERTQEGEKK